MRDVHSLCLYLVLSSVFARAFIVFVFENVAGIVGGTYTRVANKMRLECTPEFMITEIIIFI